MMHGRKNIYSVCIRKNKIVPALNQINVRETHNEVTLGNE